MSPWGERWLWTVEIAADGRMPMWDSSYESWMNWLASAAALKQQIMHIRICVEMSR